jgi:hypothetical protein
MDLKLVDCVAQLNRPSARIAPVRALQNLNKAVSCILYLH